jgi:hypothetical protein
MNNVEFAPGCVLYVSPLFNLFVVEQQFGIPRLKGLDHTQMI